MQAEAIRPLDFPFTEPSAHTLTTRRLHHDKIQGTARSLDNLTIPRFAPAALAAGIGIAYFLAARFGLALKAQVGLAIFWPAAGIAAGTLIASGPTARLPVAIGVAFASMASSLTVGRSLWLAVPFAFFDVADVLIAAWLVERWYRGVFKLESLPQVLIFLTASAIAAAVTAAAAATLVSFWDPIASPFTLWRLWFASCSLGLITVAPLLIGLADALREPPPREELIEAALALVTLVALGAFVILWPPGPSTMALPATIAFLFLIWVAVRCRPLFAAGAMFVVTLTVVWSTTFDMGNFADPETPLADRLLVAQNLMLAGTLLALVLAALFSERRRSETALQTSKERLELALDGAELGALSADLTSGCLACDARVGHIHGHSAPPCTTEELRRFIHPDDRPRIDDALAAAQRSGGRCNIDYRVLPPPGHPRTGETRWITFESTIVRDRHGVPIGLLGVTRDITERKRADQKLGDLEVQRTLASRAALVGSYAYDASYSGVTETAQISQGYAAIYGLPDATTEVTRNEWLASLYPDDADRVRMLRERAFHDRRREYTMDYRILRAGEIRWIESRTFISYNEDGHPRRVIGINIDITERKRTEERQRVLVAELDHRVNNLLATVSAVVSHTEQASRSAPDFAAALHRRIRSMATTHELLRSNRWQGLSLNELVHAELAPYARNNNAEIKGSDILLKAEAGQALAMVLHELATNAAKYGALSTKNGRVSIGWHRSVSACLQSNLVLEWRETNGPAVAATSQPGYGTSTIRDLIPYELGGAIDLVLAPEGVRCRLELSSDWLSDDVPPESRRQDPRLDTNCPTEPRTHTALRSQR
jgi:PAS domain S-box-containing protein